MDQDSLGTNKGKGKVSDKNSRTALAWCFPFTDKTCFGSCAKGTATPQNGQFHGELVLCSLAITYSLLWGSTILAPQSVPTQKSGEK